MAIGFARLEFVKRTKDKNMCCKSAYIARSEVHFQGTNFEFEKTFNWSRLEEPAHHEVLLPKGANEKFKDPEVLWNEAEQCEKRIDSQVGIDFLLALPDDTVITLEDKIFLAKSFLEKHFSSKGLAVQFDLHEPQPKSVQSELGEEEELQQKNWHCHALISLRSFTDDGMSFVNKMNRTLLKFLGTTNWANEWTQHQNEYFESKGLTLRVDLPNVIPQLHQGAVRLRGKSIDLLEKQDLRLEENKIKSKDPSILLNQLTQNKSIFTESDLDLFLQKHLDVQDISDVKEKFWAQKDLIQLIDPQSGQKIEKYTSKFVYEEERKIIRLADKIHARPGFLSTSNVKESNGLNAEQRTAYNNILAGQAVTFIEGHAGTGKSYLLAELSKRFEEAGYFVRALGPDSATAKVLEEKSFKNATNLYKFLFSEHFDRLEIMHNKEVWIVDEAGKINNKSLLELLKNAEKNQAQIIFSGNTAQLPSVERGGMFKIFCDRFGCEFLIDIQRQKLAIDREITTKFSEGKIGESFDLITSKGGFVWSKDKDESIKNLVEAWVTDKNNFPSQRSIILAHTNNEVNAVNELVRFYRKQMGEIDENEYACRAMDGDIYISKGDIIEFKKNDQKLNVLNGDSGVLTEVSENEFTVALHSGSGVREVKFNPKKYISYQLGYATTYNRAQGKTLDRAYVLSSKYNNREMFYVGLTRHVNKVYVFVSKTEAKCLSDLKKQAYRTSLKENTLSYISQKEVNQRQDNDRRSQKIEALQNSDSMLGRLKGMGLKTWDGVQSSIKSSVEAYTDKIDNKGFYNPVIDEKVKLGSVVKVKEGLMSIAAERKDSDVVNKSIESSENKVNTNVKGKETMLGTLSDNQRSLLHNYYSKSDQASLMHEVVKAEIASLNIEKNKAPHYSLWQSACIDRNAKASEVCKNIDEKIINQIFSKKAHDILNDRANTHDSINRPKFNLEDQLKDNFDSLIYKLFPDGSTRKDSQGYRFGSNGSLSVAINGPKKGLFHDFERNEGGGPLKLIQRQLNIDALGAKEWAKNFLQSSETTMVPKFYKDKMTTLDKREEWVSLKPRKELSNAALIELLPWIKNEYTLGAKYTYRDQSGNLLFYMARFNSKHDSSKKIFFPVSCGYFKGGEVQYKWGLKRYNSGINLNPIYNVEALRHQPNKPILIVEGEKTADAATKLLGDKFICVTWLGGSGAAGKVDWSPLLKRDIVVWPDNDAAGQKAANQICNSLKKIGVGSLKVVDEGILKGQLPEKWDLADPLPEGKDFSFIEGAVLRANSKAVGLDRLEPYLKDTLSPKNEALHLNEILWRIDERMRPVLEAKFSAQTWEIENAILREFGNVLNSKNAIIEEFAKMNLSPTDNVVNKSLQIMAKTGEAPTVEMLQSLKKQETCFNKDLDKDKNDFVSVESHTHKILPRENSLDIN